MDSNDALFSLLIKFLHKHFYFLFVLGNKIIFFQNRN